MGHHVELGSKALLEGGVAALERLLDQGYSSTTTWLSERSSKSPTESLMQGVSADMPYKAVQTIDSTALREDDDAAVLEAIWEDEAALEWLDQGCSSTTAWLSERSSKPSAESLMQSVSADMPYKAVQTMDITALREDDKAALEWLDQGYRSTTTWLSHCSSKLSAVEQTAEAVHHRHDCAPASQTRNALEELHTEKVRRRRSRKTVHQSLSRDGTSEEQRTKNVRMRWSQKPVHQSLSRDGTSEEQSTENVRMRWSQKPVHQSWSNDGNSEEQRTESTRWSRKTGHQSLSKDGTSEEQRSENGRMRWSRKTVHQSLSTGGTSEEQRTENVRRRRSRKTVRQSMSTNGTSEEQRTQKVCMRWSRKTVQQSLSRDDSERLLFDGFGNLDVFSGEESDLAGEKVESPPICQDSISNTNTVESPSAPCHQVPVLAQTASENLDAVSKHQLEIAVEKAENPPICQDAITDAEMVERPTVSCNKAPPFENPTSEKQDLVNGEQLHIAVVGSEVPFACAQKLCENCRRDYNGFGDRCGCCRKSRSVTGEIHQCRVCSQFFSGFINVCDGCLPC